MRQFTRTRLRRTIVAVPLIAAMLAMTGSITGCASLFKPDPALSTAAAPPKRVPTGAEKFATASDALTGSLEAAAKALKAGKRDAKALAGIADFAKSLPELDKGVQADFEKTRGILKKIKSADKDAIQAKVEKQYAERQKTLAGKLKTIASAESTAALKAAVTGTSKWLDDITPDAPYQPLGTELPHRIVNANAGPPVLGTSIAPAYAPHLKGATPSTLPVTPTPEDTTQTIEVVFTPEIESLVTSLGADPVRMYEYVRNTIDFEPYYGSRKGGTETLLEGSGNDIDTASLLIALYRKAGIPARYVSGVVDVPIAKAMNWVGVETPEAAAKLFSAGGTPTKLGISGGKPKTLRIEHTWAEAYVAYEDYRGAGAGTGPKRWVPLDASFKEYENLPRIEMDTSSVDPQALVSALASGSVETSESVTRCDLNAARDALRSAAATLSASFATSPTAAQLRNVRPIVASHPGLLPSSLPLLTVMAGSECRAVQVAMQRRISANLPGGSVFTTALAGLSTKRLTVWFEGATQADRDLMVHYDRIEDVPAYQIQVRPRISLDGQAVAEGDAVPLGAPLQVALSAIGPNGTDSFSSGVMAGGFYALVLDAGAMSPEAFKGHVDRYGGAIAAIQALAAGDESASANPEALMGEMLHAAGLVYFMQLDAAYQALSGPWRVAQTRVLAEGTVGTSVAANSLLGVASSVRPTGVSIDVRRDSHVVQSASNDAKMEAGYFQAVGGIGSILEGRMIEQVFGLEGISTVRVLQIANNSSIPILAIDSSNAWLVETLDCGAPLKADLRGAVAAGRRIVIPRSGIDYYGFQGTGWIVTDPETGESGYMIAGGLAGGQSSKNSAGSGGGSDTSWNLFAATPAYAADLSSSASPRPPPASSDVWWSLLSNIVGMGLSAIEIGLGTSPSAKVQRAGDLAGALAAGLMLRSLVQATMNLNQEILSPDQEYAMFMVSYLMAIISSTFVVTAVGAAKLGPAGGKLFAQFAMIGVVISLTDVLFTVLTAFGERTISLFAGWVSQWRKDREMLVP